MRSTYDVSLCVSAARSERGTWRSGGSQRSAARSFLPDSVRCGDVVLKSGLEPVSLSVGQAGASSLLLEPRPMKANEGAAEIFVFSAFCAFTVAVERSSR